MISVAMTTYNSCKHENYIKLQLDSIRKQTLSVDDVVIVDDHSLDNTFKYIQDYINLNSLEGSWHVYRNDENVGFIKSFSKALSLVKGDVIILCDHDDVWLPDKVRIIKDTFDSNDKILALATSFTEIDENGDFIKLNKSPFKSNNNIIRRRVRRFELNKLTLKDVTIYNVSPGCTCALRKSLINDYFKFDLYMPHDWKINFIAACKDGLYYLDVSTTLYRIYKDNTYGLSHHLNYKKRLGLCESGLSEKKTELTISELMGLNTNDVQYVHEVYLVFRDRLQLMKKKKISTKLLLKSFKFPGLWQNIVFDQIAIIKSKNNKGDQL